MTIQLTKEEIEDYFFDAMCNAISTGYMMGYGLEFDVNEKDYKLAKFSLQQKDNKEICIEDVWMEILRKGGKLTFIDLENDGEYTRSITLEDVYNKMLLVPNKQLMEMADETGDVTTSDVILQTIFFDEVIFG